MGVCRIDLQSASRVFEEKYDLTSVEGVSSFLDRVHELYEVFLSRDTLIIRETIVDFSIALGIANLTDREHRVLDMRYVGCLSTLEIARRINESEHRVINEIDSAITKISKVFSEWRYNE
ncbi:sigma factor-like helix-turn-helix DNA-binding protein [Aneurinibacillus aneurinilyticus]|uniref:sigma factor-like helix-turn-helix DNA-binding protein n=1 Tax=Aneurinibacillus aneurinilyticus TaxID=1391 RepID=UPI0023F24BD0|nr:sigma factor-like helix-turn-helix DNA-binding protein [Aneurinibacillus aneurinilyticus]